jgi:putative transposase
MGFQQSMSRRGNCYDNAYVESFFHTLKNEIETPVFRTKKEAKETTFDYIEICTTRKGCTRRLAI